MRCLSVIIVSPQASAGPLASWATIFFNPVIMNDRPNVLINCGMPQLRSEASNIKPQPARPVWGFGGMLRALFPTSLAALLLAACIAAPHSAKAHEEAAQGGAAGAAALPPLAPAPELPLQRIQLPPGFSISLYVDASFPARFMALGRVEDGVSVVYVSSTRSKPNGVITAIVDRSSSGGGVQACTLLSGMDIPNGVAYDREAGALYVTEVTHITRYDGADAAALAGCDASLLSSTVITDALPDQSHHANRALGISPVDGKLYVTVAGPFNVDVCKDPFCTIHRLDKNGSNLEIYARGIRNAAGWDWHPQTGALLFAGMERDLMGDNLPDDMLGAIDREGLDFKFPYCHWEGAGPPEQREPGPGRAIPDPEFTLPEFSNQTSRPPDSVLAQACAAQAPPPMQALGPHVAPLGVLFWAAAAPSVAAAAAAAADSAAPSAGPVQRWPQQYDGAVFVGEHGSWNREVPIGYRIAAVKLSPDGRTAVGHEVFADGWLGPKGAAWGRPVGLLRLPDSSMLVADDAANVVYRIAYGVPATPPPPPPPGSAAAASGRAAGAMVVAAALCWLALLLLFT